MSFLGPLLSLVLLAPLTASPVTIASAPNVATFTVAGTGCAAGSYSTPQTLNWAAASSCTVTLTSPQSYFTGTQYVFTGWQDASTANPRTIVTPAQATTYTATYQTQYFLTTVPDPPEGGTIAGGGWYAIDAAATVTAIPANGYRFSDWAQNCPDCTTLATDAASATLSMFAPRTVSAGFAPVIGPPLTGYVTTLLAANGGAKSPRPLNNLGQVAVYPAGIWTPSTANGTTGILAAVGIPPSSINDRGQVVGGASLWSPYTPNGTSGSAVVLGSGTWGINNYGQVLGQSGLGCQNGELAYTDPCYGFLWTPSSPNGATGTYDQSALVTSINDFGQAVGGQGLYTPSVANGTTGSYTVIPGLPGLAISAEAADINSNGTIAGSSYNFCSGIPCGYRGFLWTPSVPHGTTGTTTEIPIPPGFVALQPVALNAGGQVVGLITQANGIQRPFLYRNGTVYDLGTLSTDFAQAIPAGINDHGQMVLTSIWAPVCCQPGVYLLTPQAAPLTALAVSPGSGSASNQAMVFTFSDPRGWQDLGVVNVLINNFLDGRQSCYIAYSQPLNTLYLVNDTGNGLLPPLPLNGSGSVGNSQCAISAAGSSATGNGDTLTLMLNLTVNSTFTGNHVIYLAAGDVAGNNSSWQPLGTWSLPITPPPGPALGGVSPAYGSGVDQTFTFIFSDSKGSQDLGVVDIIINNSLDGRHACYLAYSRAVNALYLVNDAGTGLMTGGLVLTGPGSLYNSQCTVSAGSSALVVSGNTLTLTLDVSFRASFSGNQVIYLAARNATDTATSGWQAVGTWSVQ